MMAAYMRERFPSVEADDVIQETLIAIAEILPSYCYAPDEKGYFRNYLTGILRNEALRKIRTDKRESNLRDKVSDEEPPAVFENRPVEDEEMRLWREAMYEFRG